jgi:hypothetical protein
VDDAQAVAVAGEDEKGLLGPIGDESMKIGAVVP